MIDESKKKLLTKFFQALKNVKVDNVYDLGLIVSSLATAEEIQDIHSDFNVFTLRDDTNHPDFLLSALKRSFREKKWLLVDWQVDNINSPIYNLLKTLSVDNFIEEEGESGKKPELLRLPEETRVVVLAHPQRIEKFSGYQFIKLFGPVINI